jgi:TolA-binding protein
VALAIGLIAGPGSAGSARAQPEEIDAYLAAQTRVIEDAKRPLEERSRIAMETASALDRVAEKAAKDADRRSRWEQAAALLEQFEKRNPGHARSTLFAGQAAVYRWAIGRDWARAFADDPLDLQARSEADEAFDLAIARLRPLVSAADDGGDPIVQTLRFRLAQALLDRSKLESEGSDRRKGLLSEALESLANRPDDPALRGQADRLRAEVLAGLARFEEATEALEASASADPPPPAVDRAEVEVAIRVGQGRFDDAARAVDALPAGESSARDRLLLRIALARRAAAGNGEDAERAEAEAFRIVARMRETPGPEARRGTIALARAVDEPGAARSPADLTTLAEGALALGAPERAARLDVLGAERAEAGGDEGQGRSLRFQAAAILYRAGRFSEAEGILRPLASDPEAGPLRPKAALLRAVAIGRALGAGTPGYERSDYARALAKLVEDSPDSPEADEARWLLGRSRLEEGDRRGAEQSWDAIGAGRPRWLDARLAVAALRRDEVEAALVESDPDAVRDALAEARATLDRLEAQLPGDRASRGELALARAELEVVPGAGDASRALALLDDLLLHPPDDRARDRARRLRVVALTELGRYIEAERLARSLAEDDRPEALLELARRLDRAGTSAPSDLVRRRFGALLRLVAAGVVGRPGSLGPDLRAEARLRVARGELFRGDLPAARRALAAWPDALGTLGPSAWDELADLAAQLGEHERAIEVFRRLVARSRPGSPDWFQAKYGQAQALEAAGQPGLARQLIDATSALHPDLGGPASKARFDALRGRLAQPRP